MKQGDLVSRKSYGSDVIFKIQEIVRQQAVLKGVDYRLMADAPFHDLVPVSATDNFPSRAAHARLDEWLRSAKSRSASISQRNPSYFELPGKVLHLDGDPAYLRKSMEIYGALHIPAEGYYLHESKMPEALYRLLPKVKPDILVITGHDGLLKQKQDFNDLANYKNSNNFVHAVGIARQFERNRDALTIIAGACQSHFEALLQEGANFASSPARVLIHALDPLYIAAKAAFTSVRETMNVVDVLEGTHSGMQGIGGIETRGSYRRGLPRLQITQKQ
ncbi:MAG: yabG [Paenibacillaceae bacterium]|jgi:spore coat assembly protein|nr:yabG [Paenibacillaceae bacterium]